MRIVSGQYPSPPGILISHYNVNSFVYIVFALPGFGLSTLREARMKKAPAGCALPSMIIAKYAT